MLGLRHARIRALLALLILACSAAARADQPFAPAPAGQPIVYRAGVLLARDPVADIANMRSVLFTVKRGHRLDRAAFRP